MTSVLDWVLPSVFALVILAVAMILAPRALANRRAREFAFHEDLTDFTAPVSAVGTAVTKLEVGRKAIASLVLTEHQNAVLAQSDYHSALARSAACLVLASGALALSATSFSELQSIEIFNRALSIEYLNLARRVLAWLDLSSIGMLIVFFSMAHAYNASWVNLRVRAELLRQYEFLSFALPKAFLKEGALDLTAQFELEASLVKSWVQDASFVEIGKRIRCFWAERKSLIEARTAPELDLSQEVLLIYLRKRVLRQLGWFTDSLLRLTHHAEKRSRRMQCLYFLAAILACIKVGLVTAEGRLDEAQLFPFFSWKAIMVSCHVMLLPALLVVTGWSAAETAYYFNQNSRSLMHRYKAQKSKIEEFLKLFETLTSGFPNRDSVLASIDGKQRYSTRSLILQFEELMIDELVDWVYISSHDVIEVAP